MRTGDFKSKNKVTTICYGRVKVWNSRYEARKEFYMAMCCSEGAERDRYLNVLLDLENGKSVCTDEDKY